MCGIYTQILSRSLNRIQLETFLAFKLDLEWEQRRPKETVTHMQTMLKRRKKSTHDVNIFRPLFEIRLEMLCLCLCMWLGTNDISNILFFRKRDDNNKRNR